MSANSLYKYNTLSRKHYVVDKYIEHSPRFPLSVVRHSAPLPLF